MENFISILNDLIQVTKDSAEGFATAAENVQDESLKEIFLEKSESCNNAIIDLQNEVEKLGGKPEDRGSFLGAMHRGWVDIKGTLTGKDDYAILVECERGEDAIRAAYSKVLGNEIPEELRPLIQSQYEGVSRDHDLIRDLRNKLAETNR